VEEGAGAAVVVETTGPTGVEETPRDDATAVVASLPEVVATAVAATDPAAFRLLAAWARAFEVNVGRTTIGAGEKDEEDRSEEDGVVSERGARVVIVEDGVTGVTRDVKGGRITTTPDEVVSTVCDVPNGGDAAASETG